MEPKISIVIPAYNASNYLAQAIDSALAQTYKNVEILVVNDGSPDDGATREVALSYGDRIRYFEKENGGSSSALNRGIREMTGDWFSWLSHDDLYHPDKLQKQVDFIHSLSLTQDELPNHVFFAASELVDAQRNIIRKADCAKNEELHQLLETLQSNERLIAEPMNFLFHGCSCLVHRRVFEKVGGFDEQLRLVNDMDFWIRLYMAGYKIHVLSDVLVYGRVHDKQVSRMIGYSYHNPEQDMIWKRSLAWLKEHTPDRYELFYRFGRNAFQKTRNAEGDEAFAIAMSLNPSKKAELVLKKVYFKTYASLRAMLKKLYLLVRV